MWEWLTGLFDTSGFPPRWHCGTWPAWLGWLHIVADLLTFAAYTAIPIVLAAFLRRRRDLPFPRILGLFAVFILSCGFVHLIEATIFWWPLYPLSGLLKGVTAVVSLATVVVLMPTMRRALQLPGFQRVTAKLAAIVSASSDAIISKDLGGNIDSWNAAAERMYGYSADEMIGTSITRIVPPDRQHEMAQVTERLRRGEVVEPFESERITKSGKHIPVSLRLSAVLGPDGQAVGWSAISRDISEQKRYEKEMEATAVRLTRANRRLRELADRDPLTGLLNRRGFEVVLSVEVERMRRHGSRAAVILIDVDDFKGINERFGHQVGDEVLREIGDRIDDAARESDRVARIGGDEFIVLATDARVREAMLLAERIRLAVGDRPMATTAGAVSMHVSCGVQPIDSNRPALEVLVGDSSAALKLAKLSGKNTVMDGGGKRDLVTVPTLADLRALVQPIVSLTTGAAVGYELLIRGPAGPLESPDHLFRAHRETNTLTATDLACLDRCLTDAECIEGDDPIHLNVFPSTLLETPIDHLVALLGRFRDPSRICLEINEAMLIGDSAALVPVVRALRERIGCRLAIDDVGYGRSSLEALIVLEPDVVKIDRLFVDRVSEQAAARRSLARLIHVGRALRADLIAEGIERQADCDVLADLGIEFGQGYLFGRPKTWN